MELTSLGRERVQYGIRLLHEQTAISPLLLWSADVVFHISLTLSSKSSQKIVPQPNLKKLNPTNNHPFYKLGAFIHYGEANLGFATKCIHSAGSCSQEHMSMCLQTCPFCTHVFHFWVHTFSFRERFPVLLNRK